ncbi:MAG: hypothetical protein Tsb0013_15630 [Phycisphaerales bacterium]
MTPAPATIQPDRPAQPALKEVKVPDGLYWYMGAAVLVCLVVFFLLPLLLKSTSRPVPKQEATDADRD